MANLDLSKYGITDVKEVLHNPSYDVLFAEETKPGLEGFEKGHKQWALKPSKPIKITCFGRFFSFKGAC